MSGGSLGRRLIAALLAVVAGVWLAAAVYTWLEARHEVGRLLDAHLAQSASLLVAQLGHELEEIDLEHAPGGRDSARRVAFQIWERGRVLRLHSANAPAERLSAREEGFSDARIGARSWRIFSTWDARHRFLVQVGERDEPRREIAAAIAAGLLAPLAAALPLLGLFIWLTVRRSLAPLARLAAQVAARRADDVRPLPGAGVPSEVAPLVEGLNALLARVARLVENERRFTADAAHELRTPLAALKTQAQVARGATSDAARNHALDSVVAGCDRAARLVEQLLTLARLDPEQAAQPAARCDATALAREAVADLAPAALVRGIDIELSAAGPVEVQAHRALLAILLRNLLDNAVRYSPPGTTVRVAVSPSGLAVTDEGPGVAPGERERLGQRFYRALGSGETGSGLGLSIVRRIAEIHRARLSFGEGPGGKGLRVGLEWPDPRT
jgi:two-component system sensor histidine kinase QseC